MLLDVEITLNQRSLSYIEDDVQLRVLTPRSMIFLDSNTVPELETHHIEAPDLNKRAKQLLKCKEAVWRRWSQEYMKGLRERHLSKHGSQGKSPAVGDVVIFQSEEKNRGKWTLAVAENLIIGGGVVRVVD